MASESCQQEATTSGTVCCAAYLPAPPSPLPPQPKPPPEPPTTPGQSYSTTVSFSVTYDYSSQPPLTITDSNGRQHWIMSVIDIQRYALGGLANYSANLEREYILHRAEEDGSHAPFHACAHLSLCIHCALSSPHRVCLPHVA